MVALAPKFEEIERLLPKLSPEESMSTLEKIFLQHYYSEPELTIPFMLKGLEVARAYRNIEKEVSFAGYLAYGYNRTGKFALALETYFKALDIAIELNDRYQLANLYNCIGATYLEMQNFHLAVEFFFKGLEFNVKKINGRIYNNLGQVYKEKKLLEEALEYFEKSATIKREENDEIGIVFYHISVGDIYREQQRYQDALNEYLGCIEICIQNKFNTLLYVIESNLGTVYRELKQYDKAYHYFIRSLNGARSINDFNLVSINALVIAEYYQEKGELAKSNEFAKEVLDVSNNMELEGNTVKALKILESNYSALGQIVVAYKYAKQLIGYQEKIIKEIREKRFDEVLKEKNEKINILENINNDIERKNAELKQFAQIIAHDLKEPLRTIGSFTNLLYRRYADHLDEEGKEFINFVVIGTKKMNNLLSDLLSYVSLDSHNLRMREINFNNLVERVKVNLRHAIDEAEAEVIYKDLPTNLLAYSPAISQVFQNLIHNAIKFSGKDKCKVEVTATEDKDFVEFCVKDNGIGIKDAYQNRIFSLFTQLDNKKAGTGIGLSICKKIVQLHGGEIRVESKPGSGAAFYFTLRKQRPLSKV